MRKSRHPHAAGAALVLAMTLGGCITVGPGYQRPALDVPASLVQAPGGAGRTTSPADLLAWWKSFRDPVLDSLLDEAAANSQDLALAAGRIEEARAGVAGANASRYPAADAYASATRSRASENSGRLAPGASVNSKDFQLGLAASYEIDFWGKFRRADEAARARLLAQKDGRGLVLSSLVSTLAQTYFALRSYDAQLALAESALSTRQQNLQLQQRRFSAGTVGELDLQQAQAELAASEVTRAQARQLVATTEAAIALLAGRSPRDIASPQIRRGASIDELYARMVVPADLPADLLNQRPDILAAEQALRAANADIGQARAQYFPSVRLTSSAGYASNALRELVDPASLLWNIGAGLAQPVFRAGAIGALVAGAEARRTQAEAQYVQSVQGAFRDVHDALSAQTANDVIFAASTRRAGALQETLRLATLRYNNGYSSYLEVLTAQRDLLQAQATVIDAQRAHLSATVGLYRAVGGGWAGRS